MDAVGGTLKNLVYRDVMSSKCYIRNAEEFSNYANKVVNGITSIYLLEGEQLTEPEDIDNSPKILETLSIHKLVSVFNENTVCGHESLPLVYDVDQTCAFCKGKYEGKEDWLESQLSEQWFHQTCFEK